MSRNASECPRKNGDRRNRTQWHIEAHHPLAAGAGTRRGELGKSKPPAHSGALAGEDCLNEVCQLGVQPPRQAAELVEALSELATGAGLLRQRKWSVALPEATTRTLILTLESQVTSRIELEEILKWKMERGFGAPVDELSISRDRLPSDSQGRGRYIAVALRASVLWEYESVFQSLGWSAGDSVIP